MRLIDSSRVNFRDSIRALLRSNCRLELPLFDCHFHLARRGDENKSFFGLVHFEVSVVDPWRADAAYGSGARFTRSTRTKTENLSDGQYLPESFTPRREESLSFRASYRFSDVSAVFRGSPEFLGSMARAFARMSRTRELMMNFVNKPLLIHEFNHSHPIRKPRFEIESARAPRS